jgi:hypothetical protein
MDRREAIVFALLNASRVAGASEPSKVQKKTLTIPTLTPST